MRGSTLSVAHVRHAPRGQQRRATSSRASHVAGDHDRDPDPRAWRGGARCAAAPRRRRRRCRRPAGSRPVGPPAARRSRRSVELPGRDVHDPRAGRQPDPVPGLRGDQRLVPDDGQPQPAAGAGAQIDPRQVGTGQHGRDRGRGPRPARPARRWRPSSDATPSPAASPGATSTTATLVNVEPTSAQTASSAGDHAGRSPDRHRGRPRVGGSRCGGTTTVPVAVTATIGGSSTSAADSPPIRPAPADHRAPRSPASGCGCRPGSRSR